MSNPGRSLELFFVDGQPDGLVTAEMFNWTGHVLQVPRIRLKEALARPEASRTGIYVLLGETDEGPKAYVGETDDVGKRLREHASAKDWWDKAILITTASNLLHKAHVSYLESRLVSIAREAAQIPLENGNSPTGASLSDAAVANMESFIENLLVVLPALKVDLFVNKSRPRIFEDPIAKPSFETSSPRLFLAISKSTDRAFAEIVNGELIVEKGSSARETWVGRGSWDSGYRALRERLIDTGTISTINGRLIFAENYAFTSASAAAAVILGRASNGRIEWKIEKSGQTLADWETSQLESEAGQ